MTRKESGFYANDVVAYKWFDCLQWRIQDSPEGSPTSGTYYSNFLLKTTWKWKKNGPRLKSTEDHHFTTITHTSQYVEFFHSLIFDWARETTPPHPPSEDVVKRRLLSCFNIHFSLFQAISNIFKFVFFKFIPTKGQIAESSRASNYRAFSCRCNATTSFCCKRDRVPELLMLKLH